jgi:FKBP-type peptidyl-prolyl cis-trans isomerase
MKITPLLTLGLLSLGVAVATRAQDIKFSVPGDAAPAGGATPPAAPAALPQPPPPMDSFTNEQLCEEVGWAMAKQSGVTELGFSPTEVDAFMKGFAGAVAGQPSPYSLKSIIPQMNAFMGKKQATYLSQLKQQNAMAAQNFFNKVKQEQGVVVLPSGLCYKIVALGDGPYPKANEVVKVNYVGALVDGSIFDDSEKHGGPVEFQLDQVIPGWTEGIQKINKGGKIRLYIPANLAYGDDGRPGIPPGAALTFNVELLDIKPTGTAPAPGGAPGGGSMTPPPGATP